MGNNNEIRKRMETYRNVLLALVWIIGIIGMIAGFFMIIYTTGGRYSSSPFRPYGFALFIVSLLGSIIGHFFVNVGLAIPFILLNNGDYLAAILNEKKQFGINDAPVEKQEETIVEKIDNSISTTKEVNIDITSESKNAEIARLEKLFDSTTDEKEKSLIAKQLYELGQTYYWRFIPKEKK